MGNDLIIRNGRVLDPAHDYDRIADVVVRDGVIVSVGQASDAGPGTAQEYDASGCVVTPGLIDFHTHVADTVISLAKDPDNGGISTGVTTVCDAGSCGYLHLPSFARFNVPRAVTSVFALLHVSPFGEAVLPETGYELFDEARFLDTVEQYRDLIRGVKLRFIGEILSRGEVDVMSLAFAAARKAGLPVVVHTGFDRVVSIPSNEVRGHQARLLEMMEAGDVITHAFTGKTGGFFPSGEPIPELAAALGRGVLLDVAPGLGHMDFTVAKCAIAGGSMPHLLGTDAVKRPQEEPHFYSVPVVMSKLVALGLPLNHVVSMATSTPARVLGIQDRAGSLGSGMPADISVLRVHEGEFLFHDGGAGNVIGGALTLTPELVVKGGRAYTPEEVHRSHLPTPAVIEAGLAERRRSR